MDEIMKAVTRMKAGKAVGYDRVSSEMLRGNGGVVASLLYQLFNEYWKNCKFYPIPVKAVDRGRLSPGEIQAQLLHVMVEASGAPPAPRVGLLTAMNRDQWARARRQLLKDENNRTNLELISRALCLLCVDEAGGDGGRDADTAALLRCMHGAGSRHHSANRWFDKTVQVITKSRIVKI
ncbi:Choline O-acetyltransferase [Eumeta japonica]|uniref:Choline O-acetyltransferase n=1 Tax=Eumeta variegata TaxID=151549 RepID=A0A4C1YIN2_EUMVA|nr:Choline O-acetyltransferase [Eumeta japonica]